MFCSTSSSLAFFCVKQLSIVLNISTPSAAISTDARVWNDVLVSLLSGHLRFIKKIFILLLKHHEDMNILVSGASLLIFRSSLLPLLQKRKQLKQ